MYSYTHFSWVTGEISQAAYVLRNCAERSTLCKFQPQLIVGLPELMADQVSVAHCRCLSWVTFSLYGVILKRPERISAWQLLLFCRLRFSDWSRCRSSVGSSKCLKEVVHNLPSDDASKLKEFILPWELLRCAVQHVLLFRLGTTGTGLALQDQERKLKELQKPCAQFCIERELLRLQGFNLSPKMCPRLRCILYFMISNNSPLGYTSLWYILHTALWCSPGSEDGPK